MEQYKEEKDKNILEVSNSNNSIKLKVDCQYGTIASVGFIHNGRSKKVRCRKKKVIGSAAELKGKTFKFKGASGNPNRGQIKIIHTAFEEGGNELIYTFPDDYSGTPNFEEDDQEPSYQFYIKFL